MFFQRIKTPGIAHNAYILGDKNEAVVVDPRRDVEGYLQIARENDLVIKFVLETHRQEDFVLGSAELSRLTGARIVAGDHKISRHADIRLRDGERLKAAGFEFLALHTPGHTPESVSYGVYLSDAPERAWAVFTGDALFIGGAGRTDLPDPDRTAENAGLLYDVLHEKVLPLGDQALLLPAHGAGSVCGGDIAERDESTLGLERSYNPVFVKSRDAFIFAQVRQRMPRPPYFRRMEKLNLEGGIAVEQKPAAVKMLAAEAFRVESPRGIIIDTREPEAFAGGHLPDAYSVWLDGLPVFGGWVAHEHPPVFLVLADPADLKAAVNALGRIGVDSVEGVLAGGFEAWRDAGLPIERSGTCAPKAFHDDRGDEVVLDVREIREFEACHIPKAEHLWVGDLEERHGELGLKKDTPIVVTCSVGHRASLGVSILRRQGYRDVHNLLGGMTAWEKLGLPLQKGGPGRESIHR